MTATDTPGRRFRDALAAERSLHVVGAINAYRALLAGRAGNRALYLSGAGVANAGVALATYPLTAFRAMRAAAMRVHETLPHDSTQRELLPLTQTRREPYDVLGSDVYEQELDALFAKDQAGEPRQGER